MALISRRGKGASKQASKALYRLDGSLPACSGLARTDMVRNN
jgi:hypothetical protein